MGTRPLPHFAHKPIGKTTHKRGFAYQNVNYITREDACSKILAGNMPDCREDGARTHFDAQAYKDGVAANARVADTFIIALPIELTREQRWEAIQKFMDKIGQGRIAWLAAFHDKGEDEHNPHCHLILRDADIETGRKVLGTTTSAKDVKEAEDRGWKVPPRMTTKDLRAAWCAHLNSEMERHGLEARFDHRTLKEQGIDRQAQIHVGPRGQAMAEKGKQFDSQDRRRGDHANVYTLLDAGSRAEHNQKIINDNRQRETTRQALPASAREGHEKKVLRDRQAAERKSVYAEQARDREALRMAQDAQKLEHQRWGRALYASAREKAYQSVGQEFEPRWQDNRKLEAAKQRESEAKTIKAEQKLAYDKSAAKEVEAARPIKDQAWQALKQTQDQERVGLKQRHTEEIAALSRQHIAERLALHEKWRDAHATRQTNRTTAKLQNRQDMASVQTAAVTMIKQHARREDKGGALGTAYAASQFYGEQARAASEARHTIRYDLNAIRQLNETRAAAASRQRPREQARAQRTVTPREIIAQRQAREQTDKQSAIRQAVASGRSVTDADRASAQGEGRAILASQETKRKAREIREDFFFRGSERGNSGKNGGGRSGR